MQSYDPHYFNGYFNVPEILDNLKDLANGNSKSMAKKFKAKYKVLEHVVKTVEVNVLTF